MPTATTYEIGVANDSFRGAANREDLLDIITIISPTDTPLFTMMRKTKVSNVQVEWLTDLLDTAATNAVAEGSSAVFTNAVARVRLLNYTQVGREQYDISDTQRAVNQLGCAPWQHGDEKSAVCKEVRACAGTPRGVTIRRRCGSLAGNEVAQASRTLPSGASETTRGPSHAEDDMVRTAWRHAERGRNDRARRKASNNLPAGIRDELRYQMGKAVSHFAARRGNAAMRSRLYARNSEHAQVRLAA